MEIYRIQMNQYRLLLLKKYLDKMSDSDPIKKMFKQHKNINAYTKWFNAIPLLGTTALGANAYFNNNKNE